MMNYLFSLNTSVSTWTHQGLTIIHLCYRLTLQAITRVRREEFARVVAECKNGVQDMRRCPWLALALALGHPQGSQLGDKDEVRWDEMRSDQMRWQDRASWQTSPTIRPWLFRMTSGECIFSEGDSSCYGHELWQTIPFYWVRSFFLRYITATRLPSFTTHAKGQSC